MIQSRKFVAAAILMGLALIIAGLLIAPFNASASAAAGNTDATANDRIGGAFATLPAIEPDAALSAAASRLSKGDLASRQQCRQAVWPEIDASCLSRADGAPAPKVRTITIGYQAGENTTVLIRVPNSAVAAR